MEALKNKTQTFFTKDQVTGEGKETDNLEKNIRMYNKTGTFGEPSKVFNACDELTVPVSSQNNATSAA